VDFQGPVELGVNLYHGYGCLFIYFLKQSYFFQTSTLPGNAAPRIYYGKGGIKYIDTYKNGQKINRKAYDRRGKLEFNQDYPVEVKGVK